MIWRYHYFRKHPYRPIHDTCGYTCMLPGTQLTFVLLWIHLGWGPLDMIFLGFMSSLRLLRSRKLQWMSWVEAHAFPTLKSARVSIVLMCFVGPFSKASIINPEFIWMFWCSWKVLWKILKSFPKPYPSSLSARNPQVMDLVSLAMEVPMPRIPRIPWMAINHHEAWPASPNHF